MDVVLLVDDTGSMGAALANVKLGLADIITAATNASGGDLRLGLVSFGGITEVDQPLTTDLNLVGQAVNSLFSGGGGGETELSDQALKYVVTGASDCPVAAPRGELGAFRSGCLKLVILVTDAPPAGCDDLYSDGIDDLNAANVAQLAKDAGINVSAILVDNGSFISDAHPGGIEPEVMANYATTTGGVFSTVPAEGTGLGAAIEAVFGQCGVSDLAGQMTGQGRVSTDDGVRETHRFKLSCGAAGSGNQLDVEWGSHHRFHLETVTSGACNDDPTLSPNPPGAGFDTHTGTGTGRYNDTSGATVEWVFTDAGEPCPSPSDSHRSCRKKGRHHHHGDHDHHDRDHDQDRQDQEACGNDSARILIKDAGGTVVLSISGKLSRGDHRAQDQPDQ